MTKNVTDNRLNVIAALVAKANSSSFEVEQQALALRAYTQLAAYLNSFEPDGGADRRRERRNLRDRRGGGGPTFNLRTEAATRPSPSLSYPIEPPRRSAQVDIAI